MVSAIEQVCDVLDIPPLIYKTVLDETMAALRAEEMRFKPYVFLDTGFKRNNEPVFALSVASSLRILKIENEIGKLPLNEQIGHIQTMVCEHYKLNPEIHIWGKIKQYVFYYRKDIIIVLSTNGEILDVTDKYQFPTAMITV